MSLTHLTSFKKSENGGNTGEDIKKILFCHCLTKKVLNGCTFEYLTS